MKKQLIAFATLLSASSLAFAVQPGGGTGVGVSHSNNTDETTIFVPFAVGTQGMWMEPFVSYHDTEFDTGAGTFDLEQWTVGLGLFQDLNVTDQTRFYGGARLAYLEQDIDGGPAGTASDADGWQFAPTVGFGYAPVDNILFGAEAFIAFTDVEDDAAADVESTDTGTALFARYYFDAR